MKIKKFTCLQCGAPKINPYFSPYIVCDYCGTFTDVDFAVGVQDWNKDPKRSEKYAKEKVLFEQKSEALLKKGDKENYIKVQYAYWDLYYKYYPEYLPPSISSDEKYKQYIDVCAVSAMEYAFDDSWAKRAETQTKLQQAITYKFENGKSLVDVEAFFKLSDFFLQYIEDTFQDFYSKHAIMYELIPPETNKKMKLSLFVQAWIPLLPEKDAAKLLEQTHFTNEFTDAVQVVGGKQACQFCQQDLFVPKGSFKIYCEHCHKINPLKTTFNCTSCGNENSVPDNPGKPIKCISCGTENRLIQDWTKI